MDETLICLFNKETLFSFTPFPILPCYIHHLALSLIHTDASLKVFELLNYYFTLYTYFMIMKAYFVATSYFPLLLDKPLPAGAPNVSKMVSAIQASCE